MASYTRTSGTPYIPGGAYGGPTRGGYGAYVPGGAYGGPTRGNYTQPKTPKEVLEHLAMIRAGNLHGMDKIESVRGSNSPAHNPASKQEQAGNTITPFSALMAMAQGGSGGVDLSAYNKALRQSRAQEAQNKSDIGSWYGDLSGMYAKAGKADKKASRKGRREAKNFNRSIVGGQADAGVAYALGQAGSSEGSYLAELGSNQAAFDRRMGADAIAQGNWQKMVQARLGAQERSGIRSDMASAAQSGRGDAFQNMLSVLQLMPEDARMAYLTGQQQGAAPIEGTAFNNMRDALGESADTMFRDVKNPDTGATDQQFLGGRGGFPAALSQLRGAATSSGLDLNDPRVREAFRAWVAGNFTNRYNITTGGPDWALNGRQFSQYPGQ